MTLAEKIAADLKAHILSRRKPPYRLTLGGIAKHFGSSVMPARKAVDELVRRKYLVRLDNRRLGINPRRRGRPGKRRPGPPRSSAPPRDRLARDVIRLSLRGKDVFLREEATASRLGVGRTVVRHLFSQLAGEGMIEHVPRCGWRVRPFSEERMLDFLDVREALERLALEQAWPRLDPAHLNELLEANSPDASGRHRLDNRLHDYWIAQSGNPYIRDFFGRNGAYYAALFNRAAEDRAHLQARASEHRHILQALIDRDWKAACAALSEHIQGQRAHVARMFHGLARR